MSDIVFVDGDGGTVQHTTRMANKSITPHQLLQLYSDLDGERTGVSRHWFQDVCEKLTVVGGFRENYEETVQPSDGEETRRSLLITCYEGSYTSREMFSSRYKFVMEADLFSFTVTKNPTSGKFKPATERKATLLARLRLENEAALRCLSEQNFCKSAEVDVIDRTCRGATTTNCELKCTLHMQLHNDQDEFFSSDLEPPRLTCTSSFDKITFGKSLNPGGFDPRGVLIRLLNWYQNFTSSDGKWTMHVAVKYRPDGSGLIATSELISTMPPIEKVSWRTEEAKLTNSRNGIWLHGAFLELGDPEGNHNFPTSLKKTATCFFRLKMYVSIGSSWMTWRFNGAKYNGAKYNGATVVLCCDGGSTDGDTPVLELQNKAELPM